MLRLRRDLLDAVVAHCRAEHPIEACGLLAGRDDMPERHIPMANVAQSLAYYQFDPEQQLTEWRHMDAAGETPVVIYHSHTASEAYPSKTDIAYATELDAHYVIVGTSDHEDPEIRSYRITDGQATEEPIEVIEPAVALEDGYAQLAADWRVVYARDEARVRRTRREHDRST